jgi:hypothetical protein
LWGVGGIKAAVFNRYIFLDQQGRERDKLTRKGVLPMPTLKLEFTVTDHQLQIIETLRGKIPQADFLRQALQLGLCDFMDESCRVTKDFIYQGVLSQTENYSAARHIRKIEEPEDSAGAKPPQLF